MKNKDKKSLEIVILNPEALETAKEKLTKYCYEEYMQMKSEENRKEKFK